MKLLVTLLLAVFSLQAADKPRVHAIRGKTAKHEHKSHGRKRTGGDGNGILYHGGPVMLGTPTVHVIWYGNWTPASPAVPIVTELLGWIGGSPYELVNASYHDGSGAHVSGSITPGTVVFDAYSKGSVLGAGDIAAIVAAHIGKDLPADANALYFVLTSGDVSEGGFGSQYCGYHSTFASGRATIKFAFVGDASLKFATGCEAQATGPNGASGGDGMASVIAHEMEEAISDPDGDAWYFRSGNENADQCAWMFGTTYHAANGALANMKLGTRDFLIQENWLNASGGLCTLR